MVTEGDAVFSVHCEKAGAARRATNKSARTTIRQVMAQGSLNRNSTKAARKPLPFHTNERQSSSFDGRASRVRSCLRTTRRSELARFVCPSVDSRGQPGLNTLNLRRGNCYVSPDRAAS